MQFSSGLKDRFVEQGTKVLVYRNLNKANMFSVKSLEGQFKNLVIGHFQSLQLEPCDNLESMIKLSKASQARCKLQGVRNVHLGITGRITSITIKEQPNVETRLTYNPFIDEGFKFKTNNKPWNGNASKVIFHDNAAFAINKD
ncbi:hypothetical protein A6E01_20360 (plasmid) [Vibrio breoganii]|uniref:Uncharacterized protein n=1 Tax=Vibrio breoganii TaxID=553239 RepID=A0AAN1CUC7_9VIBR|nr:hypothetical protein [Vibrio breoganii]ANO35568.1 hypothetical protein A6E01_20360 [Vibrio breoganii]PML15831.1 hypothetical protein BCT84_07455 [Vibrio breoganii]